MRSKLLVDGSTIITLIILLRSSVWASTYTLVDDYEPANFFEKFNFYTDTDPTHGYVQYVNSSYAADNGLIETYSDHVTISVDHTNVLDPNGGGRPSVRLESIDTYTHGLFILNITHMPYGCGTWPAWWTLGPNWPENGEIDIIEGVNTNTYNLMSLHTSPGCSTAGANETGTLETSDCDSSVNGNSGCGVQAASPYTYGSAFNSAGGGVFAMEWTSDYIRVWFFNSNSVPASIIAGSPNTAAFGTPNANFQGSCVIDSYFASHFIVFDVTFCGDWAGNTYGSTSCPMTSGDTGYQSCVEYVANNPSAFSEAYWSIANMKVYQIPVVSSTTSFSSASLSSVTPVAATSSVSSFDAAMGDSSGITSSSLSLPSSATQTGILASSKSSSSKKPNTSSKTTRTSQNSSNKSTKSSSTTSTLPTTSVVPRCHSIFLNGSTHPYRIYCNTRIEGTNLIVNTTSRFVDCIGYCSVNANCAGVVFTNDTLPAKCVLKSNSASVIEKRFQPLIYSQDHYAALRLQNANSPSPPDPQPPGSSSTNTFDRVPGPQTSGASSSKLTSLGPRKSSKSSQAMSTTKGAMASAKAATSTAARSAGFISHGKLSHSTSNSTGIHEVPVPSFPPPLYSPLQPNKVHHVLISTVIAGTVTKTVCHDCDKYHPFGHLTHFVSPTAPQASLCFTCGLTPVVITGETPYQGYPKESRISIQPLISSFGGIVPPQPKEPLEIAPGTFVVTKHVRKTITFCPKAPICAVETPGLLKAEKPRLLDSNLTGSSKCSGFEHGSTYTGEMGMQYGIYCGASIGVLDIASQKQRTFGGCIAACDRWNVMNFYASSSRQCKSVSYFQNETETLNCHLKASSNPKVERKGADCAVLLTEGGSAGGILRPRPYRDRPSGNRHGSGKSPHGAGPPYHEKSNGHQTGSHDGSGHGRGDNNGKGGVKGGYPKGPGKGESQGQPHNVHHPSSSKKYPNTNAPHPGSGGHTTSHPHSVEHSNSGVESNAHSTHRTSSSRKVSARDSASYGSSASHSRSKHLISAQGTATNRHPSSFHIGTTLHSAGSSHTGATHPSAGGTTSGHASSGNAHSSTGTVSHPSSGHTSPNSSQGSQTHTTASTGGVTGSSGTGRSNTGSGSQTHTGASTASSGTGNSGTGTSRGSSGGSQTHAGASTASSGTGTSGTGTASGGTGTAGVGTGGTGGGPHPTTTVRTSTATSTLVSGNATVTRTYTFTYTTTLTQFRTSTQTTTATTVSVSTSVSVSVSTSFVFMTQTVTASGGGGGSTSSSSSSCRTAVTHFDGPTALAGQRKRGVLGAVMERREL